MKFGKGEAKAWELHQTLYEFVGEIGWNFYVFLLYVIGEEGVVGLFWLLY